MIASKQIKVKSLKMPSTVRYFLSLHFQYILNVPFLFGESSIYVIICHFVLKRQSFFISLQIPGRGYCVADIIYLL